MSKPVADDSREIGKDYIDTLKEQLLKSENFLELKDMFPDIENTEKPYLFDALLSKKQGLTTNFCAIKYAQDLTIREIERLMKDFEKVLVLAVEHKILSLEKTMIRGTVILVFSDFCPEEKKNMIINIQAKNVRARLHLIPIVIDLEVGEVFPPVEYTAEYYPDYPPKRSFLAATIPNRTIPPVRAKLITGYYEEIDDIKKMEHFRTILNKTQPYVTWVLLGLNIFMWLLMESYGGAENPDVLVAFGANERIALWHGEYWRLLSSVFIHIGLLHLVGNCLFLYLCGPLLELNYGREKYLLIYILSGFSGSIVSLLGMKSSGIGISAGASGALFGILGALIAFTNIEKNTLPAKVYKSLIRNLLMLVGLNLLIGVIVPNIDILAHTGGFLCGIALGYLLKINISENKEGNIFKNKIFFSVSAVVFLVILALVSFLALIPPNNLSYYLGNNYLRNENYGKAEEEFMKALTIEPQRSDIYMKLGVSYLGQNKVDFAIKELQSALTKDPKNAEVNFFLGTAYNEKGELDLALNYYQKAIDLNSKFALAYEAMGDLYRVQKKWSLAIEKSKKAIELNFLLPSAHSTLGWIYLYQQDLSEAEKEFELAKNLSSDTDFKGHVGFCAIYAYRGDFDKALQQADELKKVKDQSYLGYVLASDIYRTTGDFTRAIDDAKSAMDLESHSYYPCLYAAKAYFYGDKPQEALNCILKTVELDCNDPSAYELMALIYKRNNKLKEALEKYSSDESLIKNKMFSQLFIADCHYYNGELNRADEESTDILKNDSSLIEGHLLRIYIAYNRGKFQETKKFIEDATKIDPYDDRLAYIKGYLFFRLGEKREALKTLTRIRDLSSPLTYCARALEFYINKNWDNAEKNAQICLRSDKKNPQGNLILGLIAQKRGDLLKALSYYRVVLESDPNQIDAREKISEVEKKFPLFLLNLLHKI